MVKKRHQVMQEVKEFTFRGLSFEEVSKLKLEEFIKLIPSRERRSIKRGLTEIEKDLIKKVSQSKPNTFIRTHARDMIVLPEFVGKRFGVHNGKEFVQVDITEEMLGHRLGEFAQTRKSVTHAGPGMGATRSSKFVALK
ncbi:MAG: 30S ribosomal protein S19 [archaeon]